MQRYGTGLAVTVFRYDTLAAVPVGILADTIRILIIIFTIQKQNNIGNIL